MITEVGNGEFRPTESNHVKKWKSKKFDYALFCQIDSINLLIDLTNIIIIYI